MQNFTPLSFSATEKSVTALSFPPYYRMVG